jgi:hypothetical protein
LKNDDDILPLSLTKPQKIALIGKAARSPITYGGGSGQVYGKNTVTPYEGLLDALGIVDQFPVTIDCPSSSWKPDTYIYQDCWPPLPADTIEDCASECANSVYCRFYVFENRWDGSTWCSLYPTSYMMNSSTGGYYTTGECTRVEPAPQWQCNSDNVCLATIDGSDMLGEDFHAF